MIPPNVVYQKNNGQGRECFFFALFRLINSKKFFQYFFRNIRLKIHKLKKFHENQFFNQFFDKNLPLLAQIHS